MKKLKIPAKMSRSLHKVGFKLKKHSPEILVVTGTVGVVTSAVMACKATLKVNDILNETKQTVGSIHAVMDNPDYKDQYTAEDGKKDLAIVYTQTGVKFIKLYGPSIALGAASLACILKSHSILRKRNVALAAAYTALDNGFKEYRGRVVERFGKELDRELRYNIKAQEVTTTVVDEKGEEKTVTETVHVADPTSFSPYARCFDTGCIGWEKDAEHNLFFVLQQQNYANELLRAQGYLFLNDVYKMFGFPTTKAGQAVGWIYDEKNPIGDNFVDFGVHDLHDKNKIDFVHGKERSIWLDFNVDGVIWDLMP